MRARLGWMLLLLAAAGMAAEPAGALSLRILDSEVTVDTMARAETDIKDKEPSTRKNIRVQVSTETFTDLDAVSALGEAHSLILPPIPDPGDAPVTTEAFLKVTLATSGVLTGAASAAASGFVELLVQAGGPGDSLNTLLVDLEFMVELDQENPSSARYWIQNVTTGQTIFDSDDVGFPDQVMLPLTEGHRLQVNYATNLSTSGGGGFDSATLLTLRSALTVVPEPGTVVLLGLGLVGLVLGGGRLRH